MMAGHETTSKMVGTMSPAAVLYVVVLTNSAAHIRTLGVGQEPRCPGKTARGDRRDPDESQGEG